MTHLYLILGPTGIGKTARAVAMAATHDCPVIALDRIQCHPELAVGSGRPTAEDLAGTRRLYLDARPLIQGQVPATLAADRLVVLQQRLREASATHLVLEGGSISLLQELIGRTDWCEGWTVHVTVCIENHARHYEDKVAERVEQILGYGARTRRTLQHELAALWGDPVARKIASGVIGYREAINLCEQHSLTAQDLSGPHGRLWRYELSHRIREGHLTYSRRQREQIAACLPTLDDLAVGVELCDS